MEYRVALIVISLSPLPIFLNLFIKAKFSSAFFTISGLVLGFLLGIPLTRFDNSLTSRSLKASSIIQWAFTIGYCGYSLSIGYNSNLYLSTLGLLVLISSILSSLISLGLHILPRHESIRQKLTVIYDKNIWTPQEYIISTYLNIVLAELLGSFISLCTGLGSYCTYFVIKAFYSIGYYNILLIPGILIVSKQISILILTRTKLKNF